MCCALPQDAGRRWAQALGREGARCGGDVVAGGSVVLDAPGLVASLRGGVRSRELSRCEVSSLRHQRRLRWPCGRQRPSWRRRYRRLTRPSLWASNGRILSFWRNGCRYSSRRPVAPPRRLRPHRSAVPHLAKAGCDAHPRHLGMSRAGAPSSARAMAQVPTRCHRAAAQRQF